MTATYSSSEYLLEKCLLLLTKKGWKDFCFTDVVIEYPHIDPLTLSRLFPEKHHIITAFLQKATQNISYILEKRRPLHAQDFFIEGLLTTMDVLRPFFPLIQEILCQASLSIALFFQWIYPFYHSFRTFAVCYTPLSKNQSTLLSLFMIHALLSSLFYRMHHTEEDLWAYLHVYSQKLWFI